MSWDPVGDTGAGGGWGASAGAGVDEFASGNVQDEFASGNVELAQDEFSGGNVATGEFSGGNAEFSGEGGGEGGGGGRPFTCYNCGQDGHAEADCPNPAVPREFTGTCRLCEQTGHRAADCPTKPADICNNCHKAFACKNPRKVEYPNVEDIAPDDAWAQLKEAAEERDMDEIMEAGWKYIKAIGDLTYPALERGFRATNVGVYLIAIEKELTSTYTNMDLQGNLERKYTVTWRLSDKPMRPKEKESWPATPEENMERLADAGTPVDRGIPKCSNCDELGHMYKSCPQEKQEVDKVVVKCYNCEEIGHRMRDCPNPRPDKFACRNCKQSGHSSKECPEPRSAEGVECKKCSEIGHFSRDCPQGGGGGGTCHNCGEEGHRKSDCTNECKVICRNCDEEGHTGRECPKPRDYSRVKCSNCDQMGHTKVRCKEPLREENDGGAAAFTSDDLQAVNNLAIEGGDSFGGGNDNFGGEVEAAGEWDKPAATEASNGWDNTGRGSGAW
ncbi:hypothetical protein HYALB_00009240 [Hymenoscyphus albidus]|uniref:CCHC-type domain-containing protein n=1 Tax=Hymenoscyphus albidus TaxID=595503 RepID=A0A9N9LYX5_9HELO|nr:hypothetical protein HYALB_00009240 [Hymenoscyphus albidus]